MAQPLQTLCRLRRRPAERSSPMLALCRAVTGRLSGGAHHTEVERASWRSLYPTDVGATPSCFAGLTPADRTRLAASRGSFVLDPSAKAQPPSAAADPPVSGCTRRSVNEFGSRFDS